MRVTGRGYLVIAAAWIVAWYMVVLLLADNVRI